MKTIPCRHCNGTGKVPDQAAIGAEMKALREARKIPLREMARRILASPAFLSDLEAGRRKWQTDRIAAFKKALKQ